MNPPPRNDSTGAIGLGGAFTGQSSLLNQPEVTRLEFPPLSDRHAAAWPAHQGSQEPHQPHRKKRKSWKKPEGMPKRPLSAYNLFFRDQRQELLEDSSGQYHITDQSKRKHRKTHGKIGFAQMARLVSDKWKQLDAPAKEKFERAAQMEKDKYVQALKDWKETQKSSEEDDDELIRQVSSERDEQEHEPEEAQRPTVAARAESPGMKTAAVLASMNPRAGPFPEILGASHAPQQHRQQLPISGGHLTTPQFAHQQQQQLSPTFPTHRGSLPASFGSNLQPIIPQARASLPGPLSSTLGVEKTRAALNQSFGAEAYLTGYNPVEERRRHIEELYRRHLAEAASLRQELGFYTRSPTTTRYGDSAPSLTYGEPFAFSDSMIGHQPQTQTHQPFHHHSLQHHQALPRSYEDTAHDYLALERAREATRNQMLTRDYPSTEQSSGYQPLPSIAMNDFFTMQRARDARAPNLMARDISELESNLPGMLSVDFQVLEGRLREEEARIANQLAMARALETGRGVNPRPALPHQPSQTPQRPPGGI